MWLIQLHEWFNINPIATSTNITGSSTSAAKLCTQNYIQKLIFPRTQYNLTLDPVPLKPSCVKGLSPLAPPLSLSGVIRSLVLRACLGEDGGVERAEACWVIGPYHSARHSARERGWPLFGSSYWSCRWLHVCYEAAIDPVADYMCVMKQLLILWLIPCVF